MSVFISTLNTLSVAYGDSSPKGGAKGVRHGTKMVRIRADWRIVQAPLASPFGGGA